MQTVVLNNQASNPSKKIVKNILENAKHFCSWNMAATCCNSANWIIDSKHARSQCKHLFFTTKPQIFQRISPKQMEIPSVLQLEYGCRSASRIKDSQNTLDQIANSCSSEPSVFKGNHQNHWKISGIFAVRKIWRQHVATVQAES